MKRNRFGFLEPSKIIAVVISMILLVVGLFTVFVITSETEDQLIIDESATYSETFETDTANSNPSDTWYTYAEVGWDFANTSASANYSGSQSYLINDTNGAGNYTYFNVTARNYSYFEYYFKIDNTSHNTTITYLLDSAGDSIIRVDINTGQVLFRNYTTVGFTGSILNNTWYKLRFDFNSTTNMVRCRLINTTATQNDSWLLSSNASGTVDFSDFKTFKLGGYTGNRTKLWIDSMILYIPSVSAFETPDVQGTTESVIGLIGIVIMVSAIMGIITLVYPYIKR